MGGSGSGRTRKSYREQLITGSSKEHRTADTENFFKRLKLQAGDRIFSVDRRYDGGQWYTVGTVDDAREESVGGRFGGGVYRVYEVDKAREERTSTPPLTMKLHPAEYPFKDEYLKSPEDLEREARDEEEGTDLSEYLGPELAGRADLHEIAARIEAKIRRELTQQAEISQMRWELEQLKKAPAAGSVMGAASPVDHLSLIREIVSLTKELAPAPAFGQFGASALPPASPIDQLRQSLEMMREVQTLAGTALPGQATAAKNPMLDKMVTALLDLGGRALTAYTSNRAPIPVRRDLAGVGGGGGRAGGPQVPEPRRSVATTELGPPSPPPPTPEQIAGDFDYMIQELEQRLTVDQADQLSDAPKTHISETAQWIRSKWSGDSAPTVWVNLRDMFKQFPDAAVCEFLGQKVPALTETDKKKAWLSSLVELLRKA